MALVSCCLSAVMIAALPDLRALLLPPPPPAVVGPASASPYYLWVGLETRNPEAFQVVLESGFWANRRVDAVAHDGSVRAEIRLRRLSHNTVPDSEDGTLWIERRRRFLFREFDPGERVGRYTFSYVTHGSDE
jgi:hypothetical protein